ncbi:MAG: IS110 family transposase [Verrucomicrobia bacterium]|nr:IS110 family transposase [Verrucomicrobiota bacterium]
MKDAVIGIDVGKYELVVYCDGQYITLKNDKKDIHNWMKKDKTILNNIRLIVYEPTGGYERELQKSLDLYKLPYRRVHANHVRSYAKAKGVGAKTDHIDAKILAEFAIKMELSAKPVVAVAPKLKTLLTRREQLIEMRKQEKNRLETSDKELKRWIEKNIKLLTKQIDEIEKKIDLFIDGDAEIKKLLELYSSIPGIGRITSLQLIVDLPELLEENDKVLGALVGLAPWNRDSGTKIGRRQTRGGRIRIRGLLYMAALVAARCNAELKAFYKKLKQKGKATRVALIAVAHKLLGTLRSVAQRQTPWVAVIKK